MRHAFEVVFYDPRDGLIGGVPRNMDSVCVVAADGAAAVKYAQRIARKRGYPVRVRIRDVTCVATLSDD